MSVVKMLAKVVTTSEGCNIVHILEGIFRWMQGLEFSQMKVVQFVHTCFERMSSVIPYCLDDFCISFVSIGFNRMRFPFFKYFVKVSFVKLEICVFSS